MLHGEWFVDGERCPGGDHRLPLPEGLSERAVQPPDFPDMTGRRDKFDGCPNQFSYGTNYHQIAEWLTKTARWPVAAAAAATHLASQCDAAASAAAKVPATKVGSAAHLTAVAAAAAAASVITSSTARGFPDPATRITSCAPSAICASAGRVAAATLRAASATNAAEASAAAKAARSVCKAVATAAATACTAAAAATPSTAGIRRSSSKQVEYHGKGSCDAEGNVPKHALQDAIAKNKLFNPGTRELVLYLAQNKQAPSILKEHKSGWEAAGRFFWGYMNTDRFTKFAVPEATVKGFPNSKKQHEFDGFCTDQRLAEKSGRLGARPMWCVCPSCLLGKYNECEMVEEIGGRMRTVSLSPAPAPAAPPLLHLRSHLHSHRHRCHLPWRERSLPSSPPPLPCEVKGSTRVLAPRPAGRGRSEGGWCSGHALAPAARPCLPAPAVPTPAALAPTACLTGGGATCGWNSRAPASDAEPRGVWRQARGAHDSSDECRKGRLVDGGAILAHQAARACVPSPE